jgi:hypothetical protein
MGYYDTILAAQRMNIDVGFAIGRRIIYLREHIMECEVFTPRDYFVQRQIAKLAKEIKQLRRAMQKPAEGLSPITDTMIRVARYYPLEQIVQFNSRGYAMAWCHADKNPSLSKHPKENYARCFVCNKNFGPIDAAMELWGLTFIDAVRELSK